MQFPSVFDWILLAIGALAVAAGVRHLRRIRRLRDDGPRLTDDMIRDLEERGSVFLEEDEPLDLESIREEEERFWEEESWDEAEEW